MTGVILGMAAAGILIIARWDVPLPLNRRRYLYILAASAAEGITVRLLTEGEPVSVRLLLAVIGGSLLLAAVTDLLLCQVYNFIWWPALAAALLLLGHRCRLEGAVPEELLQLLFFLFVQLMFFGKMYGKADSYAFCVCAIAEAGTGMGIREMLGHMLLAYGILFPVQALRRNIGRRGNLKQPVPFLPYIAIAFWAVLCVFF